MPEFNFIKNLHLITLNFGGNKKIEVAGGKKSAGFIALSSSLGAKAADFSKRATNNRPKQLKTSQKP